MANNSEKEKTNRQRNKTLTHLSILLQQHLLKNRHDPIIEQSVVVIGHQKVPNPAAKVETGTFDSADANKHTGILTCRCLLRKDPCQTGGSLPNKLSPYTWSDPPLSLQPWSPGHPPTDEGRTGENVSIQMDSVHSSHLVLNLAFPTGGSYHSVLGEVADALPDTAADHVWGVAQEDGAAAPARTIGWMLFAVALVNNIPRLLAFLDLWARTWAGEGFWF